MAEGLACESRATAMRERGVRAGFHQAWRRRRRLNHFYVEPIECFHRDFASASKSASDATDASARNYNLDARVFCAIFRTCYHLDQRFLTFYSNFPTLANTKLLFPPFPSPTYLKMAIWWHHWHRFISITASLLLNGIIFEWLKFIRQK